MKLHILGSSSKGNSYVLQASNGEAIVLDAGVHFDSVKKVIDYKVNDVEAVLVTHQHGDHCKYLKSYMTYGIKVMLLEETAKAIGVHRNMHYIKQGTGAYEAGSYKVLPFNVEHDVPCVGFMIYHPEMGTTVYLTDTMYSKHLFSTPVQHWLVEANYDADILEERGAPGFLRNRVMQSHMSIETTIGLLQANDLQYTLNIVLCHLSDSNSNAREFQQKVTQATGKTVYVATPGMQLVLNKQPF